MDNHQAFFKAVCDGDAASAEALLDRSPELVNAKDDGATPLHFAAINDHREVVDLLLARGADINAIDDEYGATPAGWANEKGRAGMVDHLVERGAAIDLNSAASFGLIDRARELLDAGADVNMISGWGAPLHAAAVWGRAEVAELLLARGADTRLKNRNGHTALEIASRQVESNAADTPIVIDSRKPEIVAGCARIIELLK